MYMKNNERDIIVNVSRGHIVADGDVKPAKPASHESFELCWFVKGKGKYVIENNTYDINEGDVFLVYGGQTHSIIEITEDMDFSIVWIDIIKMLEDGIIPDSLAGILKNEDSHKNNRISKDANHYDEIETALAAMVKEFNEKSDGYEVVVNSCANQLLIYLMRELSGQFSNYKGGNSAQRSAIETSAMYILDHITEQFSLEELSQRAFLTRKYYGTLFKKVMGESPWTFILKNKVKLACNMLKTTSKNIVTIAEECGFNNTVNFNKAFRRFKGMTPREYRSKYKD